MSAFRTGIVCFLVLAALGFEPEEIAKDYAMSPDAMPETALELFRCIEEKYRSVHSLLDTKGVSSERIDRVRLLNR